MRGVKPIWNANDELDEQQVNLIVDSSFPEFGVQNECNRKYWQEVWGIEYKQNAWDQWMGNIERAKPKTAMDNDSSAKSSRYKREEGFLEISQIHIHELIGLDAFEREQFNQPIGTFQVWLFVGKTWLSDAKQKERYLLIVTV